MKNRNVLNGCNIANQRKKQSIVILVLFTLFISSCKQKQALPLSVSKTSDFRFAGVYPKGIKAKVNVVIKNPNPVDITVYRSKLPIHLNAMPVGNAKIKKRIVVPANSEIETTLYVKSKFSKIGYFDIPKLIKSAQYKSVNLSIKGDLKSGRYLSKTKNQVNMTDTINLREKAKPVLNFVSKAEERALQLFNKKNESVK